MLDRLAHERSDLFDLPAEQQRACTAGGDGVDTSEPPVELCRSHRAQLLADAGETGVGKGGWSGEQE